MQADTKEADTKEAARPKARDVVQVALLYVGVPAVTLYPLGFVALGVQLWRDPFFPYTDLTTLWEAVSLIPERVVIATGLKLIYLSVVATFLGAGIASLSFTLLRWLHKLDDEHGHESRPESSSGRLWSLYLLVLLPVAALLVWTSVPIDGWNDAGYLAAFLLFSAGGGAFMGYVSLWRRERWFFPGLVVAYVGAVLAALCIAALRTPDLPLIEIDTEPSRAESECSEASGKTFVKLSEGSHWHLYNQEGLFAVPSDQLGLIEYKRCPEYLYRS